MPRKTTNKDVPQFIANVQGGWNSRAKKFMTKDGKFSTKARALEDNMQSDFSGGGAIPLFYNTPITNAFGKFEVFTSNLVDEVPTTQPFATFANVITAAMQLAEDPEKKRPANFMLPQVQTRMRLVEHFYQTEGDAAVVCDVPVELISRKIIVECPDTALRDDIEEFILEAGLEDLVGELWRTMRVYGQAFPYECWNGKDLESIVSLYPIHVHVGYNWGYALGAQVLGEKEWTEELIESRMPPALHRALIRHWNENPPPWGGTKEIGQGIPLDGKVLYPIRDKDFSWWRYSMPMLSKGFRDLTSKIVHEDAIRALTEGFRYQLWVFKLGDKDHMPLPAQLTALRNNLSGINGDRTGMLVWWNAPLEVEVYTPKGLDVLMGSEYLSYLTKQFFRKMGITSQVVSGEMPGLLGSGTGGARGATDVDIQMYIERARFQADQVTRWAEYLCKKWATLNSKALKPLKRLRIKFAPTNLEMEKRVKDVFLPMYVAGSLDLHTLHSVVGLNYDSVTANKKEEKKSIDAGLYNPPPSFNQMVTNQQGDTKEVAQTQPKGSPNSVGELNNKMNKGQRKPAKTTTVVKTSEGGE